MGHQSYIAARTCQREYAELYLLQLITYHCCVTGRNSRNKPPICSHWAPLLLAMDAIRYRFGAS